MPITVYHNLNLYDLIVQKNIMQQLNNMTTEEHTNVLYTNFGKKNIVN